MQISKRYCIIQCCSTGNKRS